MQLLVAAYARVSTDLQTEGPEEQIATIRAYCATRGYTVVAEYIDFGVSGSMPIRERPAAQQMLADAKLKRFKGIICKQLDRLSRNVPDLTGFAAECQKARLVVDFANDRFTDDPQGRLLFGIMASIAQFYREDIGRKIRDHNRHIAQQGRYPGGDVPLGYAYNKETKSIEIDPARVGDALTVWQTYVDCLGNASEAARRINALGITPPRGGYGWRADGVLTVLRSRLYRGIVRYQEIVAPIDVPRIIPDELIAQVDGLLIQRNESKTRSMAVKYPYSGRMTCALCGGPYLVANRYHSKRYGDLVVWKCASRVSGDCSAPGISSRKLDTMVGAVLNELLTPWKAHIKGAYKPSAPKPAPSNRKRLESTRKRLVDLYLSQHISKEDFEKRLGEIDAALTEPQPEVQTVNLAEALGEAVNDTEGAWKIFNLHEKRGLLLALQARLVIDTTVPSLKLVSSLGDVDC